jgi:uncharacterized protein (TIGR00266 family)
MNKAHEIDYKIFGEELQCVEIELDPQETVLAEPGSLMYLTQDIEMHTIFGDGTNQNAGFLGKLFTAGKRLLTGENLFMTAYTNQGNQKRQVMFAAPYPGKVIPLDLTQFGGRVICQKDSFLASARGISVGIEFQKKLGVGLFGGEGFIMQKLEGDGMAFVHAGGHVIRRELQWGEKLRIDTGCLVGFAGDVTYDIEFVGGIKNSLFGGEGLFFATLSGPGTVWLQSLPFSRLAGRIVAAGGFNGQKEEGSVLGGLGKLIDGR